MPMGGLPVTGYKAISKRYCNKVISDLVHHNKVTVYASYI